MNHVAFSESIREQVFSGELFVEPLIEQGCTTPFGAGMASGLVCNAVTGLVVAYQVLVRDPVVPHWFVHEYVDKSYYDDIDKYVERPQYDDTGAVV